MSNFVQRSLADVTKEKYLDKYFKNICKIWTVESQLERLWHGSHYTRELELGRNCEDSKQNNAYNFESYLLFNGKSEAESMQGQRQQ